jgi:phospholipid/cholesterol/gamma-HCH transport system substrate-binding protein
MNEQKIRFRLGVFVLAALLLLAVLITLFGGTPHLFKVTKSFTIIFPNASGLANGSPVRKSGVKIGEVSSVQLDDLTGKVNVGIEIENKYNLHKSDRPTLMQNLLGGDSFIAFLPPEDEKKVDITPVEPGSILIGFMPTDPGTVLQRTSDLIPGAQETLVEIKKVFTKFDKMTPALEAALKDIGDVSRAARDFVPELRKTNDNIQAFTKSANDVMPDVKKTMENIQALTKSGNDAMPAVKRTVEELEVTVRNWGKFGERANVLLQTNEDKLVKTLENMEAATRRAADLLGDDNQKAVREILKDVRTGTARLDSLTRNSDELIQEARITMRTLNKSLGKADELMAQIGKVTGPIGERGPSLMKNLEEASIQLNKTLADARELLQAIGRSEGTFQKFMTDPALYNNLNDTALMATRIMPRLDRALRDFETFADKIARHPESLGLGGVVRPSSGLRDGPGFWPPR